MKKPFLASFLGTLVAYGLVALYAKFEDMRYEQKHPKQ